MEVRSVYKYARISPKKARDVAREIQGLPVSDALDTLNFTPKKAAFLIGKTLKSAVANAENNHELAADNLCVKEANICEGPAFRRYKPRARGSAGAIKKRTSHIYIILSDEMVIEEKPKREAKPKSKSKKKAARKKAAKKEAKPAEAEAEEPVVEDEEAPAAAEETPVAEDLVDEPAPEAEAVEEAEEETKDKD